MKIKFKDVPIEKNCWSYSHILSTLDLPFKEKLVFKFTRRVCLLWGNLILSYDLRSYKVKRFDTELESDLGVELSKPWYYTVLLLQDKNKNFRLVSINLSKPTLKIISWFKPSTKQSVYMEVIKRPIAYNQSIPKMGYIESAVSWRNGLTKDQLEQIDEL